MSDTKLIACPACGKKVSLKAASCPACGQPITEETKAEAERILAKKIEEDAKNKKNGRIGCLAILLFIVLYVAYGVITEPEKRFSFDEDMFMAAFSQRVNQESIIKQYGKISYTKIKSEKKESVYKLNNDAELTILKDADTGKVWQVYISYDDEKHYDEAIVVGAVGCVSLALLDFNYISLSDFSTFPNFVRRDVVNIPFLVQS